jgi:hypothetical protein
VETNYIKLNLPNVITIGLIAYTMTFLVGAGARLMKAQKAGN